MASKVMFSFFLIFSSIVHQGISQSLEELLGGLGKNMGVVKEAQCMQKLVACNKYLKDQSNVPEECCGPLREIATSNDQECLCAFFNNQQMLDSMQISRDDAMKLPNACSVPVEISTCNNGNYYYYYYYYRFFFMCVDVCAIFKWLHFMWLQIS
ncbi:hypothetical protein AHAS_Ahas05G0241800 [Arachis hypogaea]